MFCFLLLASCHSEKVMDKNQFMEVLKSLHRCDAYTQLKPEINRTEFLPECRKEAFQNLKVDSAQFQQTMAYYQKNPKEFQILYDTLVAQLQKAESQK